MTDRKANNNQKQKLKRHTSFGVEVDCPYVEIGVADIELICEFCQAKEILERPVSITDISLSPSVNKGAFIFQEINSKAPSNLT